MDWVEKEWFNWTLVNYVVIKSKHTPQIQSAYFPLQKKSTQNDKDLFDDRGKKSRLECNGADNGSDDDAKTCNKNKALIEKWFSSWRFYIDWMCVFIQGFWQKGKHNVT